MAQEVSKAAIRYPRSDQASRRSKAQLVSTFVKETGSPQLDRVVALAAKLLSTPYALITCIKGETLICLSAHEWGVEGSILDDFFCHLTLERDGVTVVPNLSQDVTFAKHALVKGSPKFRFYAGVPLTTKDGRKIGTLCVLDTQDRELESKDHEILSDLAQIALDHIGDLPYRFDVTEASGHYLENELRGLLSASADVAIKIIEDCVGGVGFWDLHNPNEVWMNSSFWLRLGYEPDVALNSMAAWLKIIDPKDRKDTQADIARMLANPNSQLDRVIKYKHADGRDVWIRCRAMALRDHRGIPHRMLALHNNVTDLVTSEQVKSEKDVLLAQVMEASVTGYLYLKPIFNPIKGAMDYQILSSNPANPPVEGRDLRKAQGQLLSELYPELDMAFLEDRLGQVLDSGVPISFEIQTQPVEDGPINWFQVSLTAIDSESVIATFLPIGALKKAQSELEKKAETLELLSSLNQSILDSSEAGILCMEPLKDIQGEIFDFIFIASNPANERLTGRTPEQLVGTTLLGEFPGNLEDGLFDRYVEVSKTGRTETFDIYYQHDGLDSWFQVSAVRHGEGGVTITFTDISETKHHAEMMKRLNEISVSNISDSTAFLSNLLDLGQRAFGCEYGICSRITGSDYKLLQTVGNLTIAGAGDVLNLDGTVCAKVVAEVQAFGLNDTHSGLYRHPALTEEEFGCYIGAPIMINGAIYGSLSFADRAWKEQPFAEKWVDFVALMAAKLAAVIQLDDANKLLQKSHDEIQLVLDNVPERIVYKAEDNTILRRNRQANEVEALIGNKEDDDVRVIAEGKPLRNVVTSHMLDDGAIAWTSTDKIPVMHKTGEKGVLVVAKDITEQREREEELERLNQSLADFAYVAAHDLQAPLRQASMFADLLKSELQEADVELNEDAQECLDSIGSSVQHMREMVRSLYSLAKLEAQTIDTSLTPMDQVVKRAIKNADSVIQDYSASIEIEALPVLPVSEELMAQVFQNLIVNACNYSNVEAPEIKIWSEPDEDPPLCRIYVQDNGVGIPESAQTRIFEPFKRATADKEGAGIGLALCRRVMGLHKGSINLDLGYGDGARFIIKLPDNGGAENEEDQNTIGR